MNKMNNDIIEFAKNGDLQGVKYCIDNGADIHAEDDYAMRLASINGQIGVVKLLLDHVADIHANNDRAMQIASENGHTEIVKLLLDHVSKFGIAFKSAMVYKM